MKLFLTLLVAFCQAAITAIPFKYKITVDLRNKKRKLTAWGRRVMALCIIGVIATSYLFYLGDSEQTKSQQELKDSLRIRDIAFKKSVEILSDHYSKKVDSSYKKSEKTFYEVTTKYGLHYDSLNKILVKKAGKELQPNLKFANTSPIIIDSMTNNRYHIKVLLASYNALSANLKVKIYIIVKWRDGTLRMRDAPFTFPVNHTIVQDQGTAYPVAIFNANQISRIYAFAIGTYTNYSGEQIHKIDQICSIDPIDHTSGILMPEPMEEIKKFIKSVHPEIFKN